MTDVDVTSELLDRSRRNTSHGEVGAEGVAERVGSLVGEVGAALGSDEPLADRLGGGGLAVVSVEDAGPWR